MISETEIIVNTPVAATRMETTSVAGMNYLTISKAADADITRLEIICKAEVR